VLAVQSQGFGVTCRLKWNKGGKLRHCQAFMTTNRNWSNLNVKSWLKDSVGVTLNFKFCRNLNIISRYAKQLIHSFSTIGNLVLCLTISSFGIFAMLTALWGSPNSVFDPANTKFQQRFMNCTMDNLFSENCYLSWDTVCNMPVAWNQTLYPQCWHFDKF
jgi:hypothetical protein